ncbi:helix-turn-helix transcriptional regulator [Romboutsia sp. MSSM.1001216sp_RTP31141st1_G3_RTP31141_220114]|uniref:helix-turn-helix domain-containing protein n=1 Tax=unclassified Romboutsia TaxID=2626894 RepID=UPI0031B5DBBD
MEIDKNLSKLLEKSNIKAFELADKAKLYRSNVYDLLNGKNTNPTIRTIKAISDALGVTVDEIIK